MTPILQIKMRAGRKWFPKRVAGLVSATFQVLGLPGQKHSCILGEKGGWGDSQEQAREPPSLTPIPYPSAHREEMKILGSESRDGRLE